MRPTITVWDPLVRIFHWSLVTSFAVAWLTGDEWMSVHEWAGYAAIALVAFRLLYGIAGPRYARFSQFVRGPGVISGYAADVVRNREPRYVGHNPLGGIMIVALLCAIVVTATSGWLMTTDAFWGVEWVEDLHKVCANGMLALVLLHVGGVVLSSLRHRENLVRSMITGRKPAPQPGDVA
ncbi:cytochrome b/b6 domain-containing protein [Mesorhizobium marinum]|uniref:Cytochrome b/b6 domain-containing protein n=1 Tax=Mesorhizobium marinum TaxID=3228790 RepID=A0ABV3R593_9HYPH